jgi:MYXO-CTERM domain-containing protein
MNRHFLRITAFAAALLTAGVSFADEDVLYWMIDSNATVEKDGVTSSVSSFFGEAPEGSAFAARVRVTGGNITEDTFLDLYVPGYGVDEGGGEWGVEFGDAGGYWGAGVPTGNQSPISAYSAGSPEFSFIVELGNIDSSDNWTTVATSAAKAYSDLADYIHQTFDINPGQLAVWTPTQFTAVPEPSGGLLTLMGVALLALRRRRMGEVA